MRALLEHHIMNCENCGNIVISVYEEEGIGKVLDYDCDKFALPGVEEAVEDGKCPYWRPVGVQNR